METTPSVVEKASIHLLVALVAIISTVVRVTTHSMVVQAATIQENSSLRRRMKQFVAESEFVKVNAVYVHMIHVLELVSSAKEVRLSIEPAYDRLWEIDPEEPWQRVLDRSARQSVIDAPTVTNMEATFD